MISRKRCREIAKTWKIEQGVAEWQRRLESIRQSDAELVELAKSVGQSFEVDYIQRGKLAGDMAWALLAGYYDPPTPHIPSFMQRLRLKDWTPPTPTSKEWPMGSAHRHGGNEC